MLVIDDVRDHHVADIRVERRGLAEQVDAAEVLDVDRDLAQDVVGGEPERIVDVDDHGAAGAQTGAVDPAEARVHALGLQALERDDLHRHPQRGPRG